MIVICGTPGTGKTTLGRMLERENYDVIHLTEFVKSKKLYTHYDEEFGSYVIDEKRMVENLLATREKVEKPGKPLIVEGIGATLLPKKTVHLCIILTCDPAIIEKRLKGKGYPRMKIERNIEAENLSVILGDALEKFGEEQCVQIDTTDLTKGDLLEKVKKLIRRHLKT